MQFDGKLGIISGRYHSVDASKGGTDHKTILEVFARCEDGRSACLLVSGMSPTFEITPLSAWKEGQELPQLFLDKLKRLEANEDIRSISGPVMKLTDLGMRPIWQVTARQPFVVPGLRKSLVKQSWQIFAGDIPFLNRLFLDNELSMHVHAKGEIIDSRDIMENADEQRMKVLKAGGAGRYAVDITVSCDVSDLSDCEPFQVPFKVFSFDLETSIEHEKVLCAAAWIEDMSNGTRQEFSFEGEETYIMEQLTLVVRGQDPDVITGYNIDNFDLPKLNDRMDVQAKRSDWRKRASLFGWGRVEQSEAENKRLRTGLIPRRQSNRAWNVAGRSIVDAWWQARMTLRPQRETLSYVAKLLFPDDAERHKMDVDASKMDQEWADRPDVVMEYCIRDAALPLDILNQLQVVRRKEAVAAVAKVSFDTAANGSSSQLVDSLIIRLADKEMVAVPLTGSAEAKEGQITGGYVHDVAAGLHPWIAVLDFKSMYPSIMIGNNI
ncbi:MAG: 3'-5' exonuclease, partial [Candidatus Poseidoniaceae archaeon]|nr:3'-5' exonuclease [Candidatus Poseidoniaceae archaeon]